MKCRVYSYQAEPYRTRVCRQIQGFLVICDVPVFDFSISIWFSILAWLFVLLHAFKNPHSMRWQTAEPKGWLKQTSVPLHTLEQSVSWRLTSRPVTAWDLTLHCRDGAPLSHRSFATCLCCGQLLGPTKFIGKRSMCFSLSYLREVHGSGLPS